MIGASSATINKAYDTAGRTITLTYFPGQANQRIFAYTYDASGALTTVQETTGTPRTLVTYSNFTSRLQPGTALFPKTATVSVRTTSTYDYPTGRLATLLTEKLTNGTPVATYQNLSYQSFDGKGNLLSLVDNGCGITHAYTYDNIDRLLTAQGTGNNPYSRSYTYDRIGNILTKSDVGTYTYTYGAKPHAVRSAGMITLAYDDNGNMTQRASPGTTLDIFWTYDNKPSLIRRNNTDYIQFTYDGNGTRVKKQNLQTGSTTLYFGEVYELRGLTDVLHIFAGSTRLVSLRSDGREQYYHGNHLGSASVIADAAGAMKERIEYFPFGTYREREDLDATFPNVNYTFTDQEDDDECGFYNYKARLYDPVLGRFISADSIVPEPGNLQAFNRYSYCGNNPVIYTDPTGHDFGLTFFIAAILIGAAAGAAVAAATGGNVTQGALTGAVSGSAFFTAGWAIVSLELATVTQAGFVYASTQAQMAGAAIHFAAGAASGAINASITGNDMGMGALTGGVSGGVAHALGGLIPPVGNKYADFGLKLVGHSLIGGMTGGITAEMCGGNFGLGFGIGAWTAAAGFLFNETVDEIKARWRVKVRDIDEVKREAAEREAMLKGGKPVRLGTFAGGAARVVSPVFLFAAEQGVSLLIEKSARWPRVGQGLSLTWDILTTSRESSIDPNEWRPDFYKQPVQR